MQIKMVDDGYVVKVEMLRLADVNRDIIIISSH